MQAKLDGSIPEVLIDIHEIQNKTHNTCTVLIDLLKRNNIEYEIKALPIGDIILPFSIVIERKTFSDFVNTLKGSSSGVLRLEQQIQNMIETYNNPVLLIENGLSLIKSPIEKCIYVPVKRISKNKQVIFITRRVNMRPNAYDGLISKFKEMGVTVIETFDAVHAAYTIFSILKNIMKAKQSGDSEIKIDNLLFSTKGEARVPIIRSRPKLMDIPDFQEFFLAGLPLINRQRAKAILTKFGNPLEAIKNIDKWQEIPGIGKKIIREVKKIIHTEYKRRDNSEA